MVAKVNLNKIKISKSQQNMLGAVTIASFVLGACLVIAVYLLKYIRFDAAIINAKEDAIQGYSDTIRDVGVCKSPKRKVYSDKELEQCDPNQDISLSDVPGTLRAKVLSDLARNTDLESVKRDDISVCVDYSTGEKLSYEKLFSRYDNSTTDEDRARNYAIFAMCSALRTIPDALPASENDLALMASVDKIFKLSNWEPESIVPDKSAFDETTGLGTIGVIISMETNPQTVMKVLRNIEKSIRTIGVSDVSITWSDGKIDFLADAQAYYTGIAGIDEKNVTVSGDGTITKGEQM